MQNTLSYFEQITIQQGNRDLILNIIALAVASFSVIAFYIDYRSRKSKERAEKSISIAESFAIDIIEPISIIFAFFEKFEIDKITRKTYFLQLEDFDIEELKTIYSEEDIEKYKKMMDTNDTEYKIRSIICNTLNKLEYMCMYIVTNVADEKCIYNSLHQQFLKAISLLYFEISFTNTDNKDKYYTNIIHVYNLWKKKYIKVSKKEERFKEKKRKMKKKLIPSPTKI